MKRAGMKRAGIIGWPVSHSRSPLIHNHWIDGFGLDAVYERCPVSPQADFRAALEDLAAVGFVGANVTIPHKEVAFAAMDVCDPVAARLGAVNTIIMQDGRFIGRNTDGAGFLASLDEAAPTAVWKSAPALVLGAGGATRAIIAALAEAGVTEIRLANRTRVKAEALRDLAPAAVQVVDWEARDDAAAGCGLLVNTTSLGMDGAPELTQALDGLRDTALVSDIVYTPLQTDLLRRAAGRGLMAVDGLGMLMHQAALAFECWFARRPDVDAALRQKLLADLQARI